MTHGAFTYWLFVVWHICVVWLTLTFESVLLPFLLKYRRTEKDSSWKDIYIITVAVIQSLHFWDKGLFTLTVSAFNWIQKWIVPFTLSCGCNNLYLFQTNVRWFPEMLSLYAAYEYFRTAFTQITVWTCQIEKRLLGQTSVGPIGQSASSEIFSDCNEQRTFGLAVAG